MNYTKIYKDFIDDRRSLEHDLIASGDYSESHHIKPRCLGGRDNKNNLIRLTPEDHFFAHLLLAKIHGGTLWAPIAFMVGGSRKDYKPTQSRKKYDWAKREMSKSTSGEKCPHFDFRSYELVHKDGSEWVGLQSQMVAIGLSKSLANMLIKGRVSQAKGWSVKGSHVKSMSGKSHPMYDSCIYDFVSISGAEFTGTQMEFRSKYGLSNPDVSLLVNRRATIRKGWHMKGADLNYRKAGNNTQFNQEVIKVKNKSGEVFSGNRSQVTEMIGGSKGNVSMMINGKRATAKGWSLL